MRSATVLVLATMALGACAPPHANGNAHGGVVTAAVGGGQLQAAANAHCARFGKVARLGRTIESGSIMFDCVW